MFAKMLFIFIFAQTTINNRTIDSSENYCALMQRTMPEKDAGHARLPLATMLAGYTTDMFTFIRWVFYEYCCSLLAVGCWLLSVERPCARGSNRLEINWRKIMDYGNNIYILEIGLILDKYFATAKEFRLWLIFSNILYFYPNGK